MWETYSGLIPAAGVGLGIAVAAGCLAYLLLGHLDEKRRDRVFSRVTANPVPLPRRQKTQEPRFSARTVYLSLGGAVLLGTFGWGTPNFPVLAAAGLMFGPIGEVIVGKLTAGKKRYTKLREVAVLYESIDLFARAGFTVRQSLQLSLPLVPNLRDVINKCLDRWPGGPLRAIQMLGEDIGLQDADVLTGVLMHAEQEGPERVAGIMEQEAVRLEGLRQSLAEARMASKPIYAAIYNFLPVMAALGMLVAPLAYRALESISSIHAGAGF